MGNFSLLTYFPHKDARFMPMIIQLMPHQEGDQTFISSKLELDLVKISSL